MKLSTRLTRICQTIPHGTFQHIWDCCCDHGYLGQQLMIEQPDSQIHFVDVAPHLINGIESRLTTQAQSNWAVHSIDAATIVLDSTRSHLVIIAGVGGDLLIEMVYRIMHKHTQLIANNRLDFVLCPVRQLHKVRAGLNALKLGLIHEEIVQENNQFYEVIQVSNQSKKSISLVGSEMWHTSNKEHMKYRNIMIRHYEKQPKEHAHKLLELYKGIPSI